MDSKKEQIQNLITKIANKTLGITEEQVSRARKIYANDTRSIEEIEAELEKLSEEITRATLRKKEMEAKETPKMTIGSEKETKEMSTEDDDDYYKTEVLDFDFEEVDTEDDVNLEPTLIPQDDNLQGTLQSTNNFELSNMFEDEHKKTSSEQKTSEKGKMLLKTNNSINNNSGYATTLNLAFMMSTISIVGLFVASIIIYASRLIG